MNLRAILLIGACFASTSALAQKTAGAKGDNPAEMRAKREAAEIADNWASAPVQEVTKSHADKISVGGRTIGYTATAGTLTIRDAAGKPMASIFYTAYTVPGAHRPVTFIYNGGPRFLDPLAAYGLVRPGPRPHHQSRGL